MTSRLLHTNLNHSSGAQGMFLQSLVEGGGGLAIASDSYRIPEDNFNWAGDILGRVAIVSQHMRDSPPIIPVLTGEGFLL